MKKLDSKGIIAYCSGNIERSYDNDFNFLYQEDMSIRPFETFVVPGIKDTLQNLTEIGFYLYSYEIEYQRKKDLIERADCLGVGLPKRLVDGGDFVDIQYIGKIQSRGYLSARVKDGNVEIIQVVIDHGKADEPMKSRLKRAFQNQLINFHTNVKDRWNEEWKFGFFELEQSNPYNTEVLYKEHQNHTIYLEFDKQGYLLDNRKSMGDYYMIAPGITYDLREGYFRKNGEPVLFYDYNAELKKCFIETLIKAQGSVVTKERLLNTLGLKNSDNQRLLEIKRSLIEFDFKKNLGISESDLLNIFVCPRGQGYRLIGEFKEEL
ncbi:hypothetical protein K2X92_06175 [Candidatus Gracilibacteria bacterium]|nr:hypothetical protein [Candidatus Gracilibacteria bacterium]